MVINGLVVVIKGHAAIYYRQTTRQISHLRSAREGVDATMLDGNSRIRYILLLYLHIHTPVESGTTYMYNNCTTVVTLQTILHPSQPAVFCASCGTRLWFHTRLGVMLYLILLTSPYFAFIGDFFHIILSFFHILSVTDLSQENYGASVELPVLYIMMSQKPSCPYCATYTSILMPNNRVPRTSRFLNTLQQTSILKPPQKKTLHLL
ncbi:hypothetical protein BGX38DRAFT_1153704, partial [Terfezia claveryi]